MIGMKNGNELVEHYLAAEKSHPDDEFDDDIFFAWNAFWLFTIDYSQ